MASSKETYCLCGQPYNIGQFMIECDCCREWFHGSCVDVKIFQSDDIDKYHCPKCIQTYGPSVLKIPTNNHRCDQYELGAEAKPAQIGTPAWVRALAARPLRPTPAAVTAMRGHQFTEELVRDGGFTKPVLFSSPDGLEMKTPNPATFTVRSVLRYCGAQLEVEVIDTRKQAPLRMPLGDFVDYFETPGGARGGKVLNVLSLEFSDTNMSALVDPPHAVRQLDWAERVWAGEPPARPAIQKYCLMSAAGSYTDWHLDFGGTSVWYHVLHGAKVFYVAPPTGANLALYQQWMSAHNQNEKFFGDMLEWYGTLELGAGQTLFIPGGWLHAVYSPRDSLVFGGNYLHSHQVATQLKVYEIERRVETPLHYRYPLFEAMHWFAGAHLLALLRRHNEESQDSDFSLSGALSPPPAPPPPLLLENARVLAAALKDWHALKPTDAVKRDNVPKVLNSGQLVRELGKELRTCDKRASAARDKDFKTKSTISPKTGTKKQPTQKKSLKLTLPKPIMHMAHNGEYIEELPKDNIIYADKQYIDTKDNIYPDSRYIAQDMKYMNNLQEAKTYVLDGKELVMPDKGYVYQTYEELPPYNENNGYMERHDKKNGATVLRIKSNAPPSSSRAPPPYPLEHSILKSQLTSRARPHTWTIKKDAAYDEHTLFTNETLQGASYGPGMYSAEDIQPDYQFPNKQPYTEYPPGDFPRYQLVPPAPGPAPAPAVVPAVVPAAIHLAPQPFPLEPGYEPLPSYDAAVAASYAPHDATPEYVVGGAAGEPAAAPRRSERPVRRRVSASYDYEDRDLYIDEAPAPRRRRRPPARQRTQGSNYRAAEPRPAPANGIESLIQASVLAEEDPPSATEDAAVEGMLSISSLPRYSPPPPPPPPTPPPAPPRTFGLAANEPVPTTGGARAARRAARGGAGASAEGEYADEEDVIKEVHRDDEYVYPALDPTSSDEDEEWAAARRRRSARSRDSRPRSDKDGAWSPRGRLGRLVPRARGTARAHVRRECVRAALTAAAARTHTQSAKKAVLATKSKRPLPPVAASPKNTTNTNSRLKKGMKTAKQRLGKILKLHKMMM